MAESTSNSLMVNMADEGHRPNATFSEKKLSFNECDRRSTQKSSPCSFSTKSDEAKRNGAGLPTTSWRRIVHTTETKTTLKTIMLKTD